MLHRVPMYTARNLDDLDRLVGSAPRRLVLIFDADNTLVPQGVSVPEFKEGVGAAVRRFTEHPSVERVIVLTNGPERGVPGMIPRGNKPFTTRRRLDLDVRRQAAWVVGDQVLTDGVLAWRLGAAFVHLAIDVETESPRQAAMRRLGAALTPLIFRHTD